MRGQLSVMAVAALGLGLLPIVALGFADGGFYPRPWGWVVLGLAAVAIAATVFRRELMVSRRSLGLLGLLAALGGWMVLSLLWTLRGVPAEGLPSQQAELFAPDTSLTLESPRSRGLSILERREERLVNRSTERGES
jgi:peptidoglycan biosynthesis protein MviN/MurJ (putative lipid II flippase)